MGMGGETGRAWSVVLPHNFSSWLVSPMALVVLGCLRLYHGHFTWALGWGPEMDRNTGHTVPGHLLESLWATSCTKLSRDVLFPQVGWHGSSVTSEHSHSPVQRAYRAAQALRGHRAPRILLFAYNKIYP